MTTMVERRATIRLRPKNQFTLPETIVRSLGVHAGDRFFVSLEGSDRVVFQRVPASYAGSMADVWPDLDAALADLRASRDAWDEREHRQLGR